MMGCTGGSSADYLTSAVAGGRESYYTGAVTAGEPPGRWYGKGAERLGLAGQVTEQDMKALYAHFIDPRDERFRDPDRWAEAKRLGSRPGQYKTADAKLAELLEAEPTATPERQAELKLQASKDARSAKMFYDCTFNVQKSVTVLHASFERLETVARAAGNLETAQHWQTYREAVEAAMWEGNRAALDYLEERAGYTRAGHHGGAGGRWVDAEGLTVASFFQHTNRDEGPHLHIHNAILNRVESSTDGKFRAIDGKLLFQERAAAGAIADRVMEEALTRTLGVKFAMNPSGTAREILGVRRDVMEMFSTRRTAITRKTEELVGKFTEKFGREPNALERVRLSQTATLATRQAKSYTGETTEERLQRFDQQTRQLVAEGLDRVAADVLHHAADPAEAGRFDPWVVIDEALASVQATQSAWTRSDLVAAVNAALPDSLGGLPARETRQVIETLTDTALRVIVDDPGGRVPAGSVTAGGAVSLCQEVASQFPAALRLENGRPAYYRPGAQVYATRDQLAAERRLRDSAVERGAASVAAEDARRFVEQLAAHGTELRPDQAAAVRGVLTSGAKTECLVGPAGAGKTFVMGALGEAWRETVGGRVLGLAASQIATEVLAGERLDAMNIARFRVDVERGAVQLGHRDLVIVDESGMADTASLEAIRSACAAAGAKMLLTGDHRQLAAVGAGGAFAMVAERAVTYELTEVRRFSSRWEADASLRLRSGDPRALLDYQTHGRLVAGGTLEQAEQKAARAYLADTLAGRQSVLIVDTNDQAGRLSGEIRRQLVGLGRVTDDGVRLGQDGNIAGRGDVVQARLNARELTGFERNPRGPINREMYRVDEVREDGSIVVKTLDGLQSMTLPAAYVAEHMTLGYATTVHSAQGLTVDTAHTVTSQQTGHASLYVGLTRGRDGNTAYVETVFAPRDQPVGLAHGVEPEAPIDVLARVLDGAEDQRAALVIAADEAAASKSVQTLGEMFGDAVRIATAGRTAELLDRLTVDGTLTVAQREQLAAEQTGPLDRLLRAAELAGHDPERVVRQAIDNPRGLDGVDNLAAVLHHRASEDLHGKLAPVGTGWSDRVPADVPAEWREHLETLAELADTRRDELGSKVAEERPQWAVEALGPVPEDTFERLEWERQAGTVAAYRELRGEEDEARAIGPAPKVHDTEDRAAWHAAWTALGRPEADAEEAEMSDGQLRCRVRAYDREETWSPEYVADKLGEVSQAEARERTEATLSEAAGRADEAAARSARLAELAEERERLELVDEARAAWYVETAATRAAADRARMELAERGVELDGDEADRVTAEEWLAEHDRSMREEDEHREIREVDLADRERDRAKAAEVDDRKETADMVARAQAALLEIEARHAEEAARIAADRARRDEELHETYDHRPTQTAEQSVSYTL
jgi:conjugative relaxase-like TrwC/TraI family protein